MLPQFAQVIANKGFLIVEGANFLSVVPQVLSVLHIRFTKNLLHQRINILILVDIVGANEVRELALHLIGLT